MLSVLLMCMYTTTDGQLLVTLIEPIMAVDEGKTLFPVCVDFIGSDLDRAVVVTLTTINTGSAQGNESLGTGGEVHTMRIILHIIL